MKFPRAWFISALYYRSAKREGLRLSTTGRAGLFSQFTGINSPYEPPSAPELEIPAGELSVDEAIALIKASFEQFKQDAGLSLGSAAVS